MLPLVKLEKWAIEFVTEQALGGKPASCGGCTMYLSRQKRCAIIGPSIIIAPVKKDGKDYTPICSAQDPGKPMDVPDSAVHYSSKEQGSAKADAVGLEWAEGAGTNCGGVNGGAACTAHFDQKDSTCRPLQEKVGAGDCCAAHGGPSMPWREAQLLLREV